MKRKKYLALLALTVCLAFVGCGKDDIELIEVTEEEVAEPGTIDVAELSVEDLNKSLENMGLAKNERVAYLFLNAIQGCRYEEAYSYLDISNDKFIDQEDFEWFLPRSNYVDLIDTKYQLDEFESEGDNVNKETLLVFDDIEVIVKTVLNDNNEWKVDFDEFYVKDWSVTVPRGATFKIDGKEVAKDFISAKQDEDEIYTIPRIAKRSTKVTVVTDATGELSQELIPSDSGDNLQLELAAETYEPILDEIKNLLNGLCTTFGSGATAEELRTYVSNQADSQLVNHLYTQLEAGYKEGLQFVAVKGQFTSREGKDVIPAKVKTNDILEFNLRLEKTWPEFKTSRQVGTIKVQKTEEGWKIYELSNSNKFLSVLDENKQEW